MSHMSKTNIVGVWKVSLLRAVTMASCVTLALVTPLALASSAHGAEDIPPDIEHAKDLADKLDYARSTHIHIPAWLFYAVGVVILLSLLHYAIFVLPRTLLEGRRRRR